jgi:hypothetical protein
MKTKKMKMANLDEESLKRLQQLEQEYGNVILALEPYYPLAKLSDEKIARLKELEQDLGVVLLAFEQ